MYYDHIETGLEVHISNIKNMFSHHFTVSTYITKSQLLPVCLSVCLSVAKEAEMEC